MPLFIFYRLYNGDRIKLEERTLPDREAACDFGVDLAETFMHSRDSDDQPATNQIVICDIFGGDLVTIISKQF